MATVREKIAYLRGLLEGTDLSGNDLPSRTVWEKMLEIFDAVADQIDELEVGQEEVEEYLEAIDADLGDLEEEVLGQEFDDGDDDDDAHFVEMECPGCGETVYFEEHFLFDDDHEVSCPECGEIIYATGAVERDTGGDDGLTPS